MTTDMQASFCFDYGDLTQSDVKRCEAAVSKIDAKQRKIATDIIAIGKELLEVKDRLPHGQFGPWLKHYFGWSRFTAARMMQSAETFKSCNLQHLTIDQSALYLMASDKCDDDTREELLERAQSGERLTHKAVAEALNAEDDSEESELMWEDSPPRRTVAAAANTGHIEWYTPAEYIQMAWTVMGSIDTDPASSDRANKVIEATTYYTQEDDGLQRHWHGNVWLNPPYAAGMVDQFTDKLLTEVSARRCKQAIVLVNNATDTQWFARLAKAATCACFKTGRIAFVNDRGESVSGAAQGQVFLYFGRRRRRFCSVFGSSGVIAEVCTNDQ